MFWPHSELKSCQQYMIYITKYTLISIKHKLII